MQLLLALAITVRVVDFAGVPDTTVNPAEKMAGYILAKAGIEVTWLACAEGSACRSQPAANEFWFQILNRKPVRLPGDVMGFAVLLAPRETAERYAGVFYPMVEESAKNLEATESSLLGAAMAHEIGHMLLGSKQHSRAGIMNPRLRPEQLRLAARGELLFTPEQADRIRKEVARRLRAEVAGR